VTFKSFYILSDKITVKLTIYRLLLAIILTWLQCSCSMYGRIRYFGYDSSLEMRSLSLFSGRNGNVGFKDGSSGDAQGQSMFGFARSGNDIYFLDGHSVRKMNVANPSSPTFTTIAGHPSQNSYINANGLSARFSSPRSLVLDATGTQLYIADGGNFAIRNLDLNTLEFTTLIGALPTYSSSSGNYVGTSGSTVGTGTSARIGAIYGIVRVGSDLYAADFTYHVIRQINSSLTMSVFAGSSGSTGTNDGIGSAARFTFPNNLAADSTFLYLADLGRPDIRKIDISTATVSSFIGTSTGGYGSETGTSTNSRFMLLNGLYADSTYLYFADQTSGVVRRALLSDGSTSAPLAGAYAVTNLTTGTGLASNTNFYGSRGVIEYGGYLYIQTGGTYHRQIIQVNLITSQSQFLFPHDSSQLSAVTGGSGVARLTNPLFGYADGNDFYISEYTLNSIRKFDTSTNTLSLWAGSHQLQGTTNGTRLNARFKNPKGMVKLGSDFYISDTGNHCIRKVDSSDNVTSLAGNCGTSGTSDGTGTGAFFNEPTGITTLGGKLYVTDKENHCIREITTAGAVTTLAGVCGTSGTANGSGSTARFNTPHTLVTDGTDLFIADTKNHAIRKLTTAGNASTFAGLIGTSGNSDGLAGAARFNNPLSMTIDATYIYVAQATGSYSIRRVAISNANVTGYILSGSAETDGHLNHATTSTAHTLYLRPALAMIGTNLWLAGFQKIRKLDTTTSILSTVVGNTPIIGYADGIADSSRMKPNDIIKVGTNFYVSDPTFHVIWRVNSAGQASIFAGSAGNPGVTDGALNTARFSNPTGLATDSSAIYVMSGLGNTIRKIDLNTNNVTTIAGTGTSGASDNVLGTSATLNNPYRGCVSSGYLFFSDKNNHAIRKLNLSTTEVSSFVGTYSTKGAVDGVGTSALVSSPSGLVCSNNLIYFADSGNHSIRKIDISNISSPVVSNIAGGLADISFGSTDAVGGSAKFYNPIGLTINSSTLYVSDNLNHLIRSIDLNTSTVTTFAGTRGTYGSINGNRDETSTLIFKPLSLLMDSGKLYMIDSEEEAIRVFQN